MCANSCSIRGWLWSGANAEPTKIHIYLISNIKISPVALQDFDNCQVSPSAGPVYGPRAQLKHSRSHHPPTPPPQSHPIRSAGTRSLEPGALVWEDNLTQSHHHLYKPTACTHVLLDLLSWYQLLFLKAFGQLEHVLPGRRGGVLSSSAGKCKYIISWDFSMLYFIHVLLWCRESPTSSWAFGFPPSSRYLSMISSLHSLAAFMNSAVSTGSICPHRHTQRSRRGRGSLYTSLTWRHSFWKSFLPLAFPQTAWAWMFFWSSFFFCPALSYPVLHSGPNSRCTGPMRFSPFSHLPEKWREQ